MDSQSIPRAAIQLEARRIKKVRGWLAMAMAITTIIPSGYHGEVIGSDLKEGNAALTFLRVVRLWSWRFPCGRESAGQDNAFW